MESTTSQGNHYNMQVYQSSILSPKTSLPTVGGTSNSQERKQTTAGSHYMNMNKSGKPSQSQLTSTQSYEVGIGPSGRADKTQSPNYMTTYLQGPQALQQAQNNLLSEQPENSFRRRHVSQIQDRMHSNTMKNMNMIQKQLQANTNMTKNRLAMSKNHFFGQKDSATVRSHTVNTTARKKVYPNKTFHNATNASQRDYLSNTVARVSDTGHKNRIKDKMQMTQKSQENLQNQTWTSSFEPFVLNQTGPLNYKVTNKKQSEGISKMNFSHAATKFIDRRKRMGSQQNNEEHQSFQEARRQRSTRSPEDESSLFKEVDSLRQANQSRQKTSDQHNYKMKDRASKKGNYRFNQMQSPKFQDEASNSIVGNLKDIESNFLDHTLSINEMHAGGGGPGAPQTISPAGYQTSSSQQNMLLFARTELDGKRLVNNISEMQQSAVLTDNTQIGDVSVMLSHTSQSMLKNSRMTATGQECNKCKAWKRINQECRNFSRRCQTMALEKNNLKMICNYVEQVASIDSLKRMTPELCRALNYLKESLKCQYEAEVTDLRAQNFTLTAKLEDAYDLAKRYKEQMELEKEKFQKINDYIHDSRYTTLMKDAEHTKFIKEESTRTEDIQDARASQNKMNYSALETDITDLKQSLKNTKQFSAGTIKIIEDKLIQNAQNSQFHLQMDDVFLREETMQKAAARDFMAKHFRYGKDPPPQTFDRGTITSQNMISEKRGIKSKAEKYQQEMKEIAKETMTQIKIENSLLCARNIHLNQELSELMHYQDKMQVQLSFYDGLDMRKVRDAQEVLERTEVELEKTQKNLERTEMLRSKLAVDKKTLMIQNDEYQKETANTIKHNQQLLESLHELRQEINHESLKDDLTKLENQYIKLANAEVDTSIKPPGPGHPQGTNMFKRHLDEQRYNSLQSIGTFHKVVKIAYTDNVPILASKQMYEKVFNTYKEQAHAQEKEKFDEQIAERDADDAIYRQEQDKKAEDAQAEIIKNENAARKANAEATAAKTAAKNLQKKQNFTAKKMGTQEVNLNKQNKLADGKKKDDQSAGSNMTSDYSPPPSKSPPRKKLQSQNTVKISRQSTDKPKGKKGKKMQKQMTADFHSVSPLTGSNVTGNTEEDNSSGDEQVLQAINEEESHHEAQETIHAGQESERISHFDSQSAAGASPPSHTSSKRIILPGDNRESFSQNDPIRIEGDGRQRSMVSLSSHQLKRNSRHESKSNLSDYTRQKAGPEEGVVVQGKIGAQNFGLVLQENRSSKKLSSRSNLNSMNGSQEALKEKKVGTKNVQISANGRIIDIERLKKEAFINKEQRDKERMQRLERLMDDFQKNPQNEEVKREYFVALKEEYGSDEELTSNPYLRHRQQASPGIKRLNTSSPNNLYPGDRPFPNFAHLHNPKYRVPTPPKIFPASRQPKDWAVYIQKNKSEAASPEIRFQSIERIGKDTFATRAARNVKENSKGIQCHINVKSITQPQVVVIKVDKQVQTMTQKSQSTLLNRITVTQKSSIPIEETQTSNSEDGYSFRATGAILRAKLQRDSLQGSSYMATPVEQQNYSQSPDRVKSKQQQQYMKSPIRGSTNLKPLGSSPLQKSLIQLQQTTKTSQQTSTQHQIMPLPLQMVSREQKSSKRIIAFSPNATRIDDLFVEKRADDVASSERLLETDRQRPVSDEEDFNRESVMIEIKTMKSSPRRIEHSRGSSMSPKRKMEEKNE